mgnify:CR=1 FL=1
MGVEAVIATQVLDTTTVGRSVMTAADAAAARTAIGAGTSSFDGAYGSLTGVPSTFTPSIHTHTASEVTDFAEATDDRVAALLVAGTNISITYNDVANTLTIANTAAGLSGTGSVDNAVLRADGTGGATLQNSNRIIADNATASPNNTVNHASIQATGSTTNVSVSIVPKGTGAFCLAVPDGTSTGGNARGANAIDLSTSRGAATDVASAANAINVGRGRASGTHSISIGYGVQSIGEYTVCIGENASANYYYGIAIGHRVTANNNSIAIGSEYASATGDCAIAIAPGGASVTGGCAIGLGRGVSATRIGEYARATGYKFSAAYDSKEVGFHLSCVTTDATPTNMLLRYFNGSARLTLSSGRIFSGLLQVMTIKSDGSTVAIYTRRVTLKNVGGTTTLVESQTLGVDYEGDAALDIAVTADDTNDALQIAVTGKVGETYRWFAVFAPALEIAYGT